MSLTYTVRLGTCNTYLIRGSKGFILVDAGNRNKEGVFSRHLRRHGISPQEIHWIIITHAHFDHVGSCHAIKHFTGAKVVAHEDERELLEKGIAVIPPGISLIHRMASYLGNRYFKNTFHFSPCSVDKTISNGISLEEWGIKGRILHTPGHTKGSLSVVLNGGKAFVGDLAANYLPFGLGGYLPPYGEDIPQILSSWETILKAGAKTIFPGHGFPIPAARLLNALKRHRKYLHE